MYVMIYTRGINVSISTKFKHFVNFFCLQFPVLCTKQKCAEMWTQMHFLKEYLSKLKHVRQLCSETPCFTKHFRLPCLNQCSVGTCSQSPYIQSINRLQSTIDTEYKKQHYPHLSKTAFTKHNIYSLEDADIYRRCIND